MNIIMMRNVLLALLLLALGIAGWANSPVVENDAKDGIPIHPMGFSEQTTMILSVDPQVVPWTGQQYTTGSLTVTLSGEVAKAGDVDVYDPSGDVIKTIHFPVIDEFTHDPSYAYTIDNVVYPAAAGTHVFTAKSGRVNGTKLEVSASVTVDRPPMVTITAPVANATYAAGTTSIALSATASDPDAGDTINNVSFVVKNGAGTAVFGPQTITANNGSYSGNWTTEIYSGEYTFEAKAVDNHGLETLVSSPISIGYIQKLQYSTNGTTYTDLSDSTILEKDVNYTFRAVPSATNMIYPTDKPEWILTDYTTPVTKGTGEQVTLSFPASGSFLIAATCSEDNTCANSIRINSLPVALAQSVTTEKGKEKTIFLSATDDGDSLSYAITSSPLHGILSTVDPVTHAVTYTSNALYSGSDSFSFTVNDGLGTSNVAVVSITNSIIYRVPNINSSVVQNSTNNDITLSVDPTESSATYTIVAGPNNGTYTITGSIITYTPTTGFYGGDTITYHATIGGVPTNDATVGISVLPSNATGAKASLRIYEGAVTRTCNYDSNGRLISVDRSYNPLVGQEKYSSLSNDAVAVLEVFVPGGSAIAENQAAVILKIAEVIPAGVTHQVAEASVTIDIPNADSTGWWRSNGTSGVWVNNVNPKESSSSDRYYRFPIIWGTNKVQELGTLLGHNGSYTTSLLGNASIAFTQGDPSTPQAVTAIVKNVVINSVTTSTSDTQIDYIKYNPYSTDVTRRPEFNVTIDDDGAGKDYTVVAFMRQIGHPDWDPQVDPYVVASQESPSFKPVTLQWNGAQTQGGTADSYEFGPYTYDIYVRYYNPIEGLDMIDEVNLKSLGSWVDTHSISFEKDQQGKPEIHVNYKLHDQSQRDFSDLALIPMDDKQGEQACLSSALPLGKVADNTTVYNGIVVYKGDTDQQLDLWRVVFTGTENVANGYYASRDHNAKRILAVNGNLVAELKDRFDHMTNKERAYITLMIASHPDWVVADLAASKEAENLATNSAKPYPDGYVAGKGNDDRLDANRHVLWNILTAVYIVKYPSTTNKALAVGYINMHATLHEDGGTESANAIVKMRANMDLANNALGRLIFTNWYIHKNHPVKDFEDTNQWFQYVMNHQRYCASRLDANDSWVYFTNNISADPSAVVSRIWASNSRNDIVTLR